MKKNMVEAKWDSFVKTGSISDYLSYKQSTSVNQEKIKEKDKLTGELPYAGTHNSNRASAKDTNHSRVR
ncbi:MAG: hypothetical protein R3Y54_11080 [Eubacteriales bacterium]